MTTPGPELIAGLRVELTIHEARNLAARDSATFGRGKTSDPYAIARYCGAEKCVEPVEFGKTPVLLKTTNPKWEHLFEQRSLGYAEAERVLRGVGSSRPSFSLHLFDKDTISADDFLGEITLPIPRESVIKKWFQVGKGGSKSKHYYEEAKGDVLLSVSVTQVPLPRMMRGNVVPLRVGESKSRLVVGLGWDVTSGAPVDLDVSCAAVGTSGRFLMEESVYYGKLENSNGSVTHSGDERAGDEDLCGSGDDERIVVDLLRIPNQILAYIFLVTVVTPGMDFSRVTSARVRVMDEQTGAGLCHFLPAYEGANTALFMMRIARNEEGGWSLATIGDANPIARDFGSLIPEIRGYCRDLVPGVMKIDPNERTAVMSKGAAVRIRDYTPVRNTLPDLLTLGLAWDVTFGNNIDLDASAICLDKNLKQIDVVYFGHRKSRDRAICHSGDEKEGDEVGDDEKITVSLANVDPKVRHVSFIINSFSGQELDDVSHASCHLFDPKTGKDLAKHTLTNNAALDKHTALLLADIYRDGSGGDWYLRVLSIPAQGKTASSCLPHLKKSLKKKRIPEASLLPKLEVVLNVMPNVVPMDEEISFVT